MDRLDAMRAFVAAVEGGSLASSARRLGVSAAAVTRAIDALEARLGMRLLQRSTRALRLSRFGETYLATCREVLATLDQAERGAEAEVEIPAGLLTVTAPVLFGELHVAPVFDAFLDGHPAVRGRLLLLDRVVDLADEGIDVAIRLSVLPDSPLVAVRLGTVRRILCAAPAYLARRGVPRAPRDLAGHAVIVGGDGDRPDLLRFRGETVAVTPRLVVNSAAVAIAIAVGGRGIVPVMSYQVAERIASGALVRLLTEHERPAVPVSLVRPPGRPETARLRAFLADAAPALRRRLTEIAAVAG